MKYNEVPEEVFQALEAVRQGGKCNMLDRACVAGQLGDLGYADALRYIIIERRGEYGKILTHLSAWRKAQQEFREDKFTWGPGDVQWLPEEGKK